MFVRRLDMSLTFIMAFLFITGNVITSEVDSTDCHEPPYTLENVQVNCDIKDISTINCQRVRRHVQLPPLKQDTLSYQFNNGTTVNVTHHYNGTIPAIDQKNKTVEVPTPSSTMATHITDGAVITTKKPADSAEDKRSNATPGAVVNSTILKTNETSNPTNNGAAKPTKIDLKIPAHNLGENGTGIRQITTPCNNSSRSNSTTNSTACVSDPIVDNSEDINLEDFKKPQQQLFGEHNISVVKTDHHSYYNSTMITDEATFNDYWAQTISSNATFFRVMPGSHRKAMQYGLKFVFPFYGQPIDSVLLTTGGFLYTGTNIHFWLSATHYIAPLMANFDTITHNDSIVKFHDNGTAFTVVWENLTLNDSPQSGKFTFATTLMGNGDILFGYKTLPVNIENIPSSNHAVKIGISDAYEVNHVDYFIRNKMLLEYHQIEFKNQVISNHTLIRLNPLPSCPQYSTCDACLENDSQFKCYWCSAIQKCSSGLDRLEQQWFIENCHADRIENKTMCPAPVHTYSTNQDKLNADKKGMADSDTPTSPAAIIISFMFAIIIVGFITWVIYAYRNPHTTSGQLLIKYRPTQWNWRRGEARYTAATIHM